MFLIVSYVGYRLWYDSFHVVSVVRICECVEYKNHKENNFNKKYFVNYFYNTELFSNYNKGK